MPVNTHTPMTWTTSAETARFRRAMDEKQRERLGTEIKRRRDYKGWTEARLAHESGVSVETISRLENAKTENPRENTIRSLARVFEITSEELAGPRLSPEEADQVVQTQLDRIEAMLHVLVSQLPGPAKKHERLIAEALQQARERNGAAPQTARTPRQTGTGS